MRARNWTGTASAPRWYCVAPGLFLGTRAITTLAAGPSFALPRDGWRALLQLAPAAIPAPGIARPPAAPAAPAAGPPPPRHPPHDAAQHPIGVFGPHRPDQAKDITVTGQVADADLGNLFPRSWRIAAAGNSFPMASSTVGTGKPGSTDGWCGST